MKKEFRPTYLYIKTHNKTGLKYFGKTVKDPFKYYGSGKYWLNHLRIYGKDISTEVVGYFTDKDECYSFALEFSKKHNIVHAVNEQNKKIWANEIDENGLDGGPTWFGPRPESLKKMLSEKAKQRPPMKEETKQKISDARKNQDMSHMKKPKSKEHIEKIRKTLTGKKASEETKKKQSESIKKYWDKKLGRG